MNTGARSVLQRLLDECTLPCCFVLDADERAALTAAIDALQRQEWRPIETAPKEIDVIVYCFGAAIPQRIAMLCPQDEEQWVWVDTGCNKLGMFPPTHWHALPPQPPTGEQTS